MVATEKTHELIEIVDMEPMQGEYANCREMQPFEACGETVQAFSPCHAWRLVTNRRFGRRCECCNHMLRYCHITQDESGVFHCFGRTCLNIEALGEDAARQLDYSDRIEQKKENGFCATFNVPQKFWDMPREQRPQFARPWKGKAMSRSGLDLGRPQWKLTVWGMSFEECLANCIELDRQIGAKLC